ncbi:MAG: 50S ribosomal protein L22 [Sneathiella sp.]
MGKQSIERQLGDTEAVAKGIRLRTSAQKLNLVAGLIRGKSAEAALTELTFSKRAIARAVKKVLQSAVANAENNHQLDVDRLYVAEAHVGKSIVMKRMRPRGRGRSSPILKPYSNITIVVREREEQA